MSESEPILRIQSEVVVEEDLILIENDGQQLSIDQQIDYSNFDFRLLIVCLFVPILYAVLSYQIILGLILL
jgi:hypothetical protein